MIVKKLGNTSFKIIFDCFQKAFVNYFVKMPDNLEYFKNRWANEGVNFDLSFGVFDGDELIAFILHAIDEREGKLTAYNAATGIIPDYRGKKLIKHMYNKFLPILKVKNIEQSILEVICDNEKAIKAYQSVGFEIIKNYKCYRGKLSLEKTQEFRNEKIEINSETWQNLSQTHFSWSNHKKVLSNSFVDMYFVYQNIEKIGYFVINKDKNMLHQFDVFENESKYWQILFQGINHITSSLKILNVDEEENHKIQVLENLELDNYINQYEMYLKL